MYTPNLSPNPNPRTVLLGGSVGVRRQKVAIATRGERVAIVTFRLRAPTPTEGGDAGGEKLAGRD